MWCRPERSAISVIRDYSEASWSITDPIKLQKVLFILLLDLSRSVSREGRIELSVRPSDKWIKIRMAGLSPVGFEDRRQPSLPGFQMEDRSSTEWKLIPMERFEVALTMVRELGGDLTCRALKAGSRDRVIAVKLPAH